MKWLYGALLFAALHATVWAAEDVPDWVRQAAAQSTPAYPAKVYAADLLHEENVSVDAEGHRVMRERKVIKVLQKSAETITAYRSYDTKAGRIRDFRGWLLPPDGAAVAFGKDKAADIAIASENAYDEARAKVLSAGSGLAPGSVFAYEVTEEEKSVFTQYAWSFQGSAPTLISRFVINIPVGWELRGTMFNHDPLEPVISGATYTWELRNLPGIDDEPSSPDLHVVTPRLGITCFPGDNKAGLRALPDWKSVSSWVSELVDPAAEVSDAIRTKSAELTRGANTEVDKIRAIAKFAQQVNYVSLQLNVTRAGGYTPHRAEHVLSLNYGDCKDKATLMRALLKAAGIESHMVLIYSSDRLYVNPEWASPHQFDHVIVAVLVSSETNFPTVLQHPRLGRLLIFDPTDSDTPLGDLPQEEQGSHALIVAGTRGELIDMPLMPASTNRIVSTADGSLDAGGNLHVHVGRQYFGQSAARAHARLVNQTNNELKRQYEEALGHRIGAITVKQASISGKIADGQMQLSLDYTVQHFTQNMSGLLIVKPGPLTLGSDYVFVPGERKLPVKLTPDVYNDSVRIQLPVGFKVDEMPDPVKLDSPYGTYQAAWKSEGDSLLFVQSMEISDALVPAAQYTELRAFFEKVGRSEAAPVVLVRK
jgi:hypothetical protein